VVVDAAGPAVESLASADEYDEAVQFAALAATAARKGKLGPAIIEEADGRFAQAKKDRDSFAAIRPYVDVLRDNPQDTNAHSMVGKYRCFVQGRWDHGLTLLARGSRVELRTVAALDLKTPRTGTPETAIADAWWEYAQTAPDDEKWGVQVRARYWYARCLPGLTGLDKVRAESRLAFSHGGIEYRPGLVCELSARQPAVLKGKRARIDPTIDFSGGEFADSARQTDLTVKWIGVIAPPRPGRYALSATTNDPVRVRVDGRIAIDTMSSKSGKREAAVVLGERPAALVVEFVSPNTDRHKLSLNWTAVGGTSEEIIPAEYLFHDKRGESVLGK
jgi:hypothetical protein